MLQCNRLHIDIGDGSAAVDYRIEFDCVEKRTLEGEAEIQGHIEKPWHRVPADQLRAHVMKNTVVARWLRRRMGIHRLIQACNQETTLFSCGQTQPSPDHRVV